MNKDYNSLLEKYRRELSDIESKRAVCVSKMDELCAKLGIPTDVSIDELAERRRVVEEKRKSYEARLEELIAKIDGIV